MKIKMFAMLITAACLIFISCAGKQKKPQSLKKTADQSVIQPADELPVPTEAPAETQETEEESVLDDEEETFQEE